MTPRERVRTAFNHEPPDRVPCRCGASEEFWSTAKRQLGCQDEPLRVHLGDDFRRVLPVYAGPRSRCRRERSPEPSSASSETASAMVIR